MAHTVEYIPVRIAVSDREILGKIRDLLTLNLNRPVTLTEVAHNAIELYSAHISVLSDDMETSDNA
jgi:hypothetical protein